MWSFSATFECVNVYLYVMLPRHFYVVSLSIMRGSTRKKKNVGFLDSYSSLPSINGGRFLDISGRSYQAVIDTENHIACFI